MFYAGLDLGSKRSRLGVCDEKGNEVFAGWVKSDWELVQALAPWGKELRIALEATSGAFWVHDVLKPHVGEVWVAHPRDLRAIAHARVKNDRLDEKVIRDLNRGGLIPVIWVPPVELRQQRELLLEQARITQAMRTQKVKVRALLRRWGQGEKVQKPFTQEGLKALQEVALPQEARYVLEGKLEDLEWQKKRYRKLVQEIKRKIGLGPREQRLMSLPGVGEITARAVSNVLGDVSRFRDARQVSHYVGLTPGERSSGQRVKLTGITKEGNPWIRSLMVQCAWRAVRSAKDPTQPWRRMYAQLVKRGKSKARAIVAVANRLVRVAYAVLRDERNYEIRSSRPGER